MNVHEIYNERIAAGIIENLKKRQMEGYYCATAAEAKELALSLMEKGCSIGWGGSATAKEIGLMDAIRDGSYQILDRSDYTNEDEKMAMYARILRADWFLMSTNAITLDGELINIDGRSDRISFMCFGPRNVLIIAGINKVVPDTETGLKRAKDIAGVKNATKLGRNTPCAKTGFCCDCLSPECICSQVLITRRSAYKNRIKVILVGEELGF